MQLLSTNGAASSTRARGYLGHQLPTWERVALAAEHYEEGRPIVRPTLPQICLAYRVSIVAVMNERAKRNKRKRNGHNDHSNEAKPSLAEQLLHATPAELIEAGQVVGIGRLWDSMIVPNLDNRKAAE
jgi:hypothetical protein